MAKEISTSEYPIFDPSLIHGLNGLTVQTNDEYSGLEIDSRYWHHPHEPPYVNVEPPHIMIDDGRQPTNGMEGMTADEGDATKGQARVEHHPPSRQPVPAPAANDSVASSSHSAAAVVTVTEAVVPAPPTSATPLSFIAARVETSDVEEEEEEEEIPSARIGSRLSQHSNPQTLDFTQLENRTSPNAREANLVNLNGGAATENANEKEDKSATGNGIVENGGDAGVVINGQQQRELFLPHLDYPTPQPATVPKTSSAIDAKPPPSHPQIMNPTTSSTMAPSLPFPSFPGGRTAAFAPTNDLPAIATAAAAAMTGNSFAQFAFPYPVQGRDPGTNPYPYPLNDGSSQTAGLPCAYPYPRDREKILKGTLMLSPSMAGLGGGGGGSKKACIHKYVY